MSFHEGIPFNILVHSNTNNTSPPPPPISFFNPLVTTFAFWSEITAAYYNTHYQKNSRKFVGSSELRTHSFPDIQSFWVLTLGRKFRYATKIFRHRLPSYTDFTGQINWGILFPCWNSNIRNCKKTTSWKWISSIVEV